MRSKDFKKWEFLGEFMTKELPGLEQHDHSCTDFFKLGNKHMMLLISHSWGVRYYLGEWKDNKFTTLWCRAVRVANRRGFEFTDIRA